jgi:spore coat-associated protein N
MRSVAILLTSFAMALAAIGLAVAAPGGSDPEVAGVSLGAASGSVSITNSRDGQAVFSAAGMRPGEDVSGTVRIGNHGASAGRFELLGVGAQDTAGPNGGLLSERVELVVLDVTGARPPVTLFAGHPADFVQVDLGMLAPGENRDYRFEATLPDGGVPSSNTTGDNRYQGSSLSLGFQWQASPVAAMPTPETPVTPANPNPKPPVTKPIAIADALGLPRASTCINGGRLKLKLKGVGGAQVVSATITVNGRVKTQLKGAKARKTVSLRGLRKKTALRVTVRASDRHTYTGTRTYRACAKRR